MPFSDCSYSHITETPLTKGSQEQLDRLYTRYKFAQEFCQGRNVIEIGCGAGLGLGLLASVASRVIGGDIDPDNLKIARETYRTHSNVEILKIDAQSLPFHDAEFDVVILYEAIYYFPDPEKFLQEAKRVLRPGGVLIIGSANKEWAEFNPSPHSHHYFAATELYDMLESKGFTARILANCAVHSDSLKSRLIGLIKKISIKLNLIPKTMKGKEFFKRMFMGRLILLPAELKDGMGKNIPFVQIERGQIVHSFKVIFAVGVLN